MTTRADQLPSTSSRWRAPAVAAYAVALGVWIALIGVPTDPFQMFVWLWLVTIAWRPSAPWRYHLGFAHDWAPAFGLLVIYLYSRGLSDEWISMPVHWTMPIRVDEWLGGGELPTTRLQDAWCAAPCTSSTEPRWYDAILTTVYFTHFVAGLTIAVVLWLRSREAWIPWMRRYLVINFSALVVYILYPMAPPWLASKEGYIAGDVPRLTGRGWDDLGLGGFHVVLAKVGNPVAAMPSLHGGLAMLIVLYAITRLSSPWRWLLLTYPLLMGLALVYSGEHYVIDIVAGWALAALVMAGCGWWERTHPRTPPLTT
ncbi:phosphatase PAP2 family protein [Aeromicrobium sp. NPDC092404]|uniref:phosphatase PAP2 family protein n=1 Tax=Aeromicrobium sp. NPDC092404 TaxID=3154976 RepID=UPI00343E5F5C